MFRSSGYMIFDNTVFDALMSEASASPRLRMNMDLRNSPEDGSQRMLNALEMGTVMPIHRHRSTSETQLLLRGVMDVIFYDNSGLETQRFRLDPLNGNYGVNIPAGQWHSLEVIEPSVLFEAKDGPYAPLTEEDILKC